MQKVPVRSEFQRRNVRSCMDDILCFSDYDSFLMMPTITSISIWTLFLKALHSAGFLFARDSSFSGFLQESRTLSFSFGFTFFLGVAVHSKPSSSRGLTSEAGFSRCLSQEERHVSHEDPARDTGPHPFHSGVVSRCTFLNSILNVQHNSGSSCYDC